MKALAFIVGMAIRPFSAGIMVWFTMKALAFIAGMAIRPFSAGIMVWFTYKHTCLGKYPPHHVFRHSLRIYAPRFRSIPPGFC